MPLSLDNPETRKIYSIAVALFAVVGFLASITTIAGFFRTDSPDLSVEVYPSKTEIPYFFDASIGRGFNDNGRSFIEKLSKVCEKSKSNIAGAGQPPAKTPFAHDCKHLEDLRFMSDQLSDLRSDPGSNYEFEITNTGAKAASGIRLSDPLIKFLDAYIGPTQISTEYNEKLSAYNLPDINPGEEMRVVVWMKSGAYQNGSIYDFELPKLTYNGRIASVKVYAPVPDAYYNMYDFLSSIGTPLAVIFILAICFFIGIFILIILAMIDALFKGRPLSSIFKTNEISAPVQKDAEVNSA